MDTRKTKLFKSLGVEGFGERAGIYKKSRDFPWATVPTTPQSAHVGSALLLWSLRLWMNCTPGKHKTE